MSLDLLPRLLVPAGIGIAFALFRKYFPAKSHPELERYDRPESDRLPTGAFGFITVCFGISLAVGGFFALVAVNSCLRRLDGPALLRVFPGHVIWCFLPGFAALAVPWPVTIAILRRSRFRDDAAYIEAEGSAKGGFDCYRVMVGFIVFVIVPIAIATIFALPMRLSFAQNAILLTRYATWTPQVFRYADATKVLRVEGYRLRDGSFERHADLVIDFRDGRRLSANAVGDGGSEPSAAEIALILQKTGLTPQLAHTLGDVP